MGFVSLRLATTEPPDGDPTPLLSNQFHGGEYISGSLAKKLFHLILTIFIKQEATRKVDAAGQLSTLHSPPWLGLC